MRISKVEKIGGEHEVIDIQVAVDSSFVVHGCVLHNSTICKHYDGMKIYSNSKVKPRPPFHPRCRTTTTPIISSDFDFLDVGAKRAARGADGGTQVSADMTYYDFLKTQPAWFQDDALGPVRGKIFRNAGMTTEEFNKASVDGFGRPLTLKEMAEADKKVADYLYN